MDFLVTEHISFQIAQHAEIFVIDNNEHDFSITLMAGDGSVKNSKHGHINDIA